MFQKTDLAEQKKCYFNPENISLFLQTNLEHVRFGYLTQPEECQFYLVNPIWRISGFVIQTKPNNIRST